jgi:PadR family transcriptional regulator PadR
MVDGFESLATPYRSAALRWKVCISRLMKAHIMLSKLSTISLKVSAVDKLQAVHVECLLLMAKHERYQNRIELLQGTLDMLILRALSWGPEHGYGISQAIRTGSSDVLHAETGSLYPALHRLEKHGWVKSEWSQSENRQRAKYYRLTPSGRKQLVAEHSRWKQMSAAIASLMEPKGSEG